MAAIEIDSNTIIKLLARRGSDVERQNIVLSEGEFGYVVDLKRLYIGDGFTPGGIPTSIKFHNTTTDITSIAETVKVNDLVYKSDTNEIYKLATGTGSTLSDWELIASPSYVNYDGTTLSASSAGTLFVKEISGQHISDNAIGAGLVKTSDQISLSSSIAVNRVDKIGDNLTLPTAILFSDGGTTQIFNFPTDPGLNKYHLVTDGSGNLAWEPASVVSAGTVFMADTITPVGSILFYAVSSFTEPVGWLMCDGRAVSGVDYPELSAAIGTTYGGDGINEFNLPDLMSGGVPFGVNRGIEAIGTTYPILTGITSQVYLTGSSMTTLSATLSAGQTINTTTPLNGVAGIWLIKYRADNPVTTQINVLSSNGLSAYSVTNSQSTTAINLSGEYHLTIPTGNVGEGNPTIVAAYRRARAPQMFTYTASGTDIYTVSDGVYRIKVTATGAGGVGYTEYSSVLCRANGVGGGAGSTIVAYVNVEPGQVYKVTVGARGYAQRTPAPTVTSLSAGEGGTTSFDLSASDGSITNILSAGGAYDAYVTDAVNYDYNADWSGGGRARGGFKGGEVYTPSDPSVVTYYNIRGGDGGQFFEYSAEGTGGASMWGTGPAPGGGGSGYAKKDTDGREIAQPGNGIVIVEEL